jgi:hypothetical protein
MSRPKKYPRFGCVYPSQRTKRKGTAVCKLCAKVIKPGDGYTTVDIQWDWFRGNDAVVTLCSSCRRGPLTFEQLKSLTSEGPRTSTT